MISIKELKELDEQATPGPWKLGDKGYDFEENIIEGRLHALGECSPKRDYSYGMGTCCANAYTVITLRNSLPQIIERLEDAEELRESVLKNEYIHQHKLAVKQEKKWGDK